MFTERTCFQMDTPIWETISEAAKDLLKRMLTVDPNKRITVQEILNHRWLRVRICSHSRLLSYITYEILESSSYKCF